MAWERSVDKVHSAESGTSAHPVNRGFGVRHGVQGSSESLTRVTVQWKPSLQVFRVPAIFLKAKSAIVAHEDIDAIVTGWTVKG